MVVLCNGREVKRLQVIPQVDLIGAGVVNDGHGKHKTSNIVNSASSIAKANEIGRAQDPSGCEILSHGVHNR